MKAKTQSNVSIEFDPNNWSSMINLMNEYGSTDYCFSGENIEGESIRISILTDKIITCTYQSNGWIRKNVYHREDLIIETLFDGKWR